MEWVRLADLSPHPRNYRQHPPDQIEHLQASLMEYGWFRNVVVARGDVILAGHGIVTAALGLGWGQGPVYRLDLDADSAAALKVLALDNEVGRFAEVDDRALTTLLQQIRDESPTSLVGTGYDDSILQNLLMLTRPASEITPFDVEGEWVGMPDYDSGSRPWQLNIAFDTEADREAFLAKYGAEITITHINRTVTSAHWPLLTEVRNDSGLVWEETDGA